MGKEVYFYYSMTLIVLAAGIGHFTASVQAVAISDTNMLQMISVCPSVSFVNGSYYLTECSTTLYHNKYTGDGSVPKCMVIYDIMNRICTYQSTVNINDKLQLPHSANDFDAHLKKLEPKPSDNIDIEDSLCNSIESLFHKLESINVQPVKEVIPYKEEYVNKILLKRSDCKYVCHDPKEVNKLCMVLYWANQLFSTVPPVQGNSINKDKLAVVKNASTVNGALQTTKETLATVVKSKGVVHTSETELAKPKVEQQKNKQVVDPVKNADKGISDITKKTEYQKQENIDSTKIDNAGKLEQTLIPAMVSSSKDKQSLPSPSDKKPEPKISDDNENHMQPILQSEDNPEEEVVHASEDQKNKKNDDPPKDFDQSLEPEAGDKLNEMEKEERPLPDDDQDSLIPYQNKRKSYSVDKEVESHVFGYFFLMIMCCIFMYIGYSNKQKILAMVLEGRRGRRGRGNRRRPSTASYRKLDSNLEEAVTSQCSANVTHVIY
ncbi:uncharacterized protein LOC106643256 isoform X2 [Copidosoma floridanum]|uniref:uncharacterized protein LOC106643256 isoform X2 n=1 Tax=Copidosoma floridanum TaxID=29053 RepID=UPI0006C94A40|nr:uncharacterized protein LOC106643256 isoform X2 [Copidosoma floridanum]